MPIGQGVKLIDFKSLNMQEDYLTEFAAAFVRGKLGLEGTNDELVDQGREAGLRMHRFKRSTLPRVSKCIGLLKGIYPQTLLDIGTGRGAFLWTMLDEISSVDVTCLDVLEHRVELVNAVSRGGVSRIRAQIGDVQDMRFEDKSFDVATALEVVEHLTNPGKAVSELCRVSRNYILVSVPSKPDNNPEHINLFSAEGLEKLLLDNGAQSVQIYHVLNHRIALGKL